MEKEFVPDWEGIAKGNAELLSRCMRDLKQCRNDLVEARNLARLCYATRGNGMRLSNLPGWIQNDSPD